MTVQDLKVKSYPNTWTPGWSVSRYDTFKTCLRQYFYHYYGRHDPDIPREKIEYLKTLTSIPLETGSIVHDVIATTLERLKKSTEPIDRGRFSRHASRLTRETMQTRNFSEVHYGKRSEVSSEAAIPGIMRSLESFLDSERYTWIVESAEKGDAWLIEPPNFGETRLGGLKAFCKPDFICHDGNDWWVFDWKTGKQNPVQHARQLNAYAGWAVSEFDAPADRVQALAVYLSNGYVEYRVEETFSAAGLIEIVRKETEEIYSVLEDIEGNRPKSKEHFPEIDPAPICGWCNYRELCGR